MVKKFVVLVVDGELSAQDDVRSLLLPHAEVLSAMCLEDAMFYICKRDDINVVILDYHVPKRLFVGAIRGDTTQCLISPIQNRLGNIPVYSASSNRNHNIELRCFGCIIADKQSAPKMVLEYILGQRK